VWKPAGTEWAGYYAATNYTDASLEHKAQVVADYLGKVNPKTVWDLGANTGRFSRIATALKVRGKPIPTNDMWIAAQAMETGAELLSFDRHYQWVEGLAWRDLSERDR
jgi:hypothetical protein